MKDFVNFFVLKENIIIVPHISFRIKAGDIIPKYTCNLVYQNFGENVGYLNMAEDLFLDDKGIL